MAIQNRAAWLTAAKAKPFMIDESPYPECGEDDLVIRIHASAINPLDWYVQDLGVMVTKFPHVLGLDAAGEVISVGSNVKGFKPGDRVTSLVDALSGPNGGSFQYYTKARPGLTAKIPDSVSYAQGSVLPLTISTAAVGLFQKDTLDLPLPKMNPQPSGQIVLIWGGSSSVGSCAIQLAVAAGVEVATTASSKNHEYCKTLGAKWVFDHTSETVVEDIVEAFEGKEIGVFDAISRGDTPTKCEQCVFRTKGRNFLQTVMPARERLPDLSPELETGIVWAGSLIHNEVGPAVWGEWIPKALEAGVLKCKPDPVVVGKGLEMFQVACDRGLKGELSAQKLVVELP